MKPNLIPNLFCPRVRSFQEKQYQLAAQKRHEADLKCNYYKQTVKFFERESEIAKHFNSWNLKQKSPYLEKTLKAEKLRERQVQLRSILKIEEEQYKKELKALKSKKNPLQDFSIEALKQQLKEKKAEQSLYLPRDCRRVQSYFYNTRDCSLNNNLQFSRRSINFRMNIRDTCPWSMPPQSTSPPKSPKRDEAAGKSTGVLNEPYFMNLEHHQTGQNSQLLGTGMKELLHEDGHQEPDPKYSARYSRRTLEQTNLRGRGEDHNPYNYQNQDSPVNSPERRSASVSPANGQFYEDETDYQREINTIPEDDNVENGTIQENGKHQEIESLQDVELHQKSLNGSLHSGSASSVQEDIEKGTAKLALDSENAREKTSCENYERERSLPWMRDGPREQNLSVQMFRYLAHNDLKRQILDLGQRELLACRKQWWSQALRLRDMRNRLELMREKNLYNTLDLHLDEESKKAGLGSIGLRELRVTEREEVCKNSAIYE